MKPAPIPANEADRLHLLHELDILDTEPEPVFDQITALAKDIFQVDAAIITLVDGQRQWFKSKVGFAENETPRDVSFCAHAVAQGSTMVVNDATGDERFVDNPYVTAEGGLRFYAGATLELGNQLHLGTLCIIDSQPREFSEQQQRWLEALATWVTNELQARYLVSNFEHEREVLAQGPVAAVVWQTDPVAHLIYAAENVERVLGYSVDYLLDPKINYESIVHPEDREQLLERMQAVLEGKQEHLELEYRVVQHQGTHRWVHHYARADYDRSGQVSRVRGYIYDNTKRKNLELKLQYANHSFALALQAGDLSTWDWDLKTQRLKLNQRWEQVLGYDQPLSFDNQWAQFIHPQDFAAAREALQLHLQGKNERFEARFRMRHADGHDLWIHTIGKAIERDAKNRVLRMAGIHHDITQEVMNEQKRVQQEAILELVSTAQHEFLFVKEFSEVCDLALPKLMELTNSTVGVIGELPENSRVRNLLWLHGLQTLYDAAANDTYQKLIKQGLEVEVSGSVVQTALLRGEPQLCPYPVQSDEALFTPLALPELANALILPLYFKRQVVGLLLLANSDNGYQREQLAILEPILNTLGTLMHIRRMDKERQSAVEQLRHMATTDELTQIANRRVFLEAAEQRFLEYQRYDIGVSIAIVDLDNFKVVNDNFGHAAGDFVLQQFTEVAQKSLRDGDLLGRTGGEEFGILFAHADIQQAMRAAERVRKAVAATDFVWQQQAIPVTISVGVAQLQATDADVGRWIARADKALYAAKKAGRNRCLEADEV